MKNKIKKVCVIGSGVMGSGIAASIANISTNILLLDIIGQNSNNRNEITEKALARINNQRPPALAHPNKAKFISIGNLDDDLKLISECDLVIEVIIEDIDSKHKLYQKIIPYLNDHAILSSNTSTLLLKDLKSKLPDNLRPRFFITHFFNPPRYMELVELVTDHETDNKSLNMITHFLEMDLGKTVVKCKDTPGFIANRVGCFLLELTVRQAIKEQLNPVIIDKIFSKLFGIPSTGIFGLYDLIGHDVMQLISKSLINNLPKDDSYNNIYQPSAILEQMSLMGLIGRKSGGGFYRITIADGKKVKEFINFNNLSYHPVTEHEIEFQTITELLTGNSPYSNFFNKILEEFYTYLIGLIPVVSNNIQDIDLAMQLGYSWKNGPFELLFDYIANEEQILWFKKLKLPNEILSQIITKPFYRFIQNNINLNEKSILSNNSAQLVEYQKHLVFSIETKMGCLNIDVFKLLMSAIEYAELNKQNLYIFSETANFSAGADLKFIKNCVKNNDLAAIEELLVVGQQAMMRMRNSKVNIISCARGVALGGGCELLLHSDYIVMHQELYAGLVEVQIGVIPSFGGLKEMLLRAGSGKTTIAKNLKNILTYNKSSSAYHFIEDYGITNSTIIMSKKHFLDQALSIKLPVKIPPIIQNIEIPEMNLAEEIDTALYNEFQMQILLKFQQILTLKTISIESILQFERSIFIELVKNIR